MLAFQSLDRSDTWTFTTQCRMMFLSKGKSNPKKEAKAKQEDNESWIRRHEGQSWYTSIKWVPNTVEYPLLNKVKVPCREDSNYIPTKNTKRTDYYERTLLFCFLGFFVFNSAVEYLTNRRRYLIRWPQNALVFHLRSNKQNKNKRLNLCFSSVL